MIWEENHDAETLEMIAADPDMEKAAIFADNFVPNPSGDYKWVTEYAPKLYESRLAIYHKLDDRASSLLTWLTAAIGLFASGATVAISEGKLVWWVGLCFLPSFACAGIAIYHLLRSRGHARVYPSPAIDVCVSYVHNRHPKGDVAIVGRWHMAITSLTEASNRRATMVSYGIRFSVISVALLLIPFACVVFKKAVESNRPTPSVIEERQTSTLPQNPLPHFPQ